MNLRKKVSNSVIKSDWLFFTVVFIAFYLLNTSSISVADDYWYSIYKNGDVYQPISSFKEIIDARLNEYMTHNGRFIVHSLVSLFCGILGFELFKFLNSIVFLLLVVGVLRLIRIDYGNNSVDKYIVLLLLFVFLPYPGQILLGSIAMCVNYLWTSCVIVWFLILYNYVKQRNSQLPIWWSMIYFITAVVVGSMQESFTIGLSVALFVYYIFHLKEFKGVVMWLVLGLWIGTAITTLAPGNFARLESNVSDDIFKGIDRYARNFSVVISNSILIVFILSNVITARINMLQYKIFVNRNILVYGVVFFSAILNTIVCSGQRQLTCIVLISSILLIKLLYEFYKGFIERYRNVVKIGISIVLIIIYIPVFAYRAKGNVAYEQLYNSKVVDGCVINDSYYDCIKEFRTGLLSSRYTYLPEFERWIYLGFSLMKTSGNNINEVRAILAEPQEYMLDKYNKFSNNSVYYDKHKHYYILGQEFKNKVYTLSEPQTILGKIRNKVLGKKNIYRIDITDMLHPFECNGKRYYYFTEPEYKVFDFVFE